MAKGSEYRMAIKIAGEIEKSLYNCTDLTRKELNKIAKEAAYTSSVTKESFGQGLKETEPLFDGLEKAGTKAFEALAAAAAAAGTAMIGIGTMSAQAGIEFESAFAGVKKTTTATADEYAQMKEEILAMTREIPASGAEIAAVAEAAGQLGIEKENLLAFSRTMIDLGESTNLSSEEAASALAKFANITNMSAGDYDRLGSVIVDLGNNFATTEADIVSMATNMASAGELAGFTEPQIMAMATAMSSVGIEAEAGGSAMSKMIKKVQVAVETGSDSLEDYASVAGQTVEEFKKDFQKDGLTAVANFISGLNDVERNGKSATVILDEMGLTEVRLSNTLTSLANADNLMLEAVETANGAWDANIALANEAAQRYETTESKIAVMQNGFTEMGIAMYDQFNEPLREGIDIITDLVHEATAEISGSNVIHDLAQDIVNGIPTAMHVIQNMAEAVGNFADPFLEVGGWLADNPALLTTTIAEVGTALASYKIAKGVASFANMFKTIGASSGPVLGAIGGITALVGAGTYLYTQYNAEMERMTQISLEEHFGNIALSMEEVNEVARQVVGEGYLDKMDELLSATNASDNIFKSMKSTINDINREKWKLSVGLDFSAEDKEEYARDAQEYIAEVQNYISSEGYAFQVTAELLLSDSVKLDEMVVDNNEFYEQLNRKMMGIGDDVSNIINNALEKGLEIDQEEINNLLAEAQEIQDALTNSKTKASWETLQAKYSGADLNADTVQNLMQEINNTVTESNEEIWNAYNDNVARLGARLELDENYTPEQYELDKEELLKGTRNKQAESEINAYKFFMNTMEDAYSDVLGDRMEDVDSLLENVLERSLEETKISENGITAFDAYYLAQNIGGKIKGRDGRAVAELWENISPIYNEMEETRLQYTQSGQEAPEELKELMKEASVLGVLAGDYNSIYSGLGVVAEGNEKYQTEIEKLQIENNYIPEQIAASILGNTDPIDAAVNELYAYTEQLLGSKFSNKLDVEADVNLKFRTASMALARNAVGSAVSYLPGHAEGGIFDKPHVAWFSEEGPEAAIPIDGSVRSVNLWQQTGEMLGVFNRKDGFHALAAQLINESGSSSSSTVNNSEENSNITLSPVFEIHANGDNTENIEKAIREIVNGEFREMVEDVLKKKARDRERFSFS